MSENRRQIFVSACLFAIYMFFLVWLILFKLDLYGSNISHIRVINLIPFAGTARSGTSIIFREVIYNVIAFIPFGLYLSILAQRWSFFQKLIFCMGISLMFECMQYLVAIGASDITDIIANTFGGLIGILLFALFLRIIKTHTVFVINIVAITTTILVVLYVLFSFYVRF